MENEIAPSARQKRGRDVTGGKRQSNLLKRLQEDGGKPIRVDTHGPDVVLLDELVASGYAPSRAEAYRQSMRDAHARMKRRLAKTKA